MAKMPNRIFISAASIPVPKQSKSAIPTAKPVSVRCCGNTDQNKMNVARRTCGYIGTQYWNQGRTQEIKDRVLHL